MVIERRRHCQAAAPSVFGRSFAELIVGVARQFQRHRPAADRYGRDVGDPVQPHDGDGPAVDHFADRFEIITDGPGTELRLVFTPQSVARDAA